MTLTDYIISLLLVSVVVRQVRGRRLTTYTLIWPVLLVIVMASNYFHGLSTKGNDLAFIITVGLVGAILGIGCGLLTKVFLDKKGRLIGKATWAAVALWILGTCARVVFALYASHGGGSSIARFSAEHNLSGIQVWVNALLLMSLAEVGGRTLVLAVRTLRFRQSANKNEESSHTSVFIQT